MKPLKKIRSIIRTVRSALIFLGILSVLRRAGEIRKELYKLKPKEKTS